MSLALLLDKTGIRGGGDTGRNVPESKATLEEQVKAVKERRQRAVMYPAGTSELPLPEGLQRIQTARGVFHYDPAQTTAEEIESASNAQEENRVLGLGPASKAQVVAQAMRGEPMAAVVERTPGGVEVKAAVATPSTAPAAMGEMAARRGAGNTVQVEPVAEVVSERVEGGEKGGLAELLARTSEEPAKGPPGLLRGLANSGRRGLLQAAQAIDAATMGLSLSQAEDAEEEVQRIAAERDEDPPPSRDQIVKVWGEAKADRIYGIALDKWKLREAQREERLANNARFAQGVRTSLAPAYAGAIGRRQAEVAAIPLSAPMQSWEKAETVGEALKVLARDPVEVIGNLAVSGVTSGSPALAAGAAGSLMGPAGTVAGAGVGSFVTEYGGKLVEEIVAAGGDFNRPESVLAVLNDPQRIAAIREKAVKRGIPVAIFDAISAGLAGKLIGAPAKSALEKGARIAGEAGIQASMGAAGEAAGSVAAGDEVSGKAMLEEALASVGSGAAEVATGVARDRSLAAPERVADQLAPTDSAEAPADAQKDAGAEGVDVFAPMTRKPKVGKPADTLAAAINRRPDDDFKPSLERMEGADVDLVAQLARYGEATRKADEDFPAFAERMTEKFGERVQAYLGPAWGAVSGGTPVRDLVPTENPLKLEGAWKRAAGWGKLFWQGSADVLRGAGVKSLADAVETHVDLGDRNLSQAWAYVKPAVEQFQGIGGIANRGRAKRAFDEFEAFYRARENGRVQEAERILAQSRPETRHLIASVGRMFAFTGTVNRSLGVRVRDRDGTIRPIGYLGADNFPRMLREEVLAVLRDPSSDPVLWQQMQAELVAHGNIESREEAAKFVSDAVPAETSSDHFGSLEKARRARLPESWYEYRFEKVIPRYVAEWSERTAQIEAFGQKLAETDRDAFDVALSTVRNPELSRYIEATREHAYRVNRLNPAARKAIGNLTSATTALFLGNPYSSLRNLIGGTAQTVNQMGVVRSIGALRSAWAGIPDAEAVGALKADVADLLFHDDGSMAMRKGAGVALKLGGFNAAEQFVRSHNLLTARTFLRDALRQWRRNPESRASLQAVAFFRRHGVNPDKLASEAGKGPETNRFLRGAVRQAQGSYRYSQVPLFTDGPLGRFLLQFARWGTMATRFHAEHIIQPAIVGELVPVRTARGGVEMRRVRTILPLIRSPFVAAAAGATTFAVREAAFGIERADAEWDEIWRTMDDDEQRGVSLALNRFANDIVMGGTFGALSDYSALLRDAAERSRFRNPVEPPAASILKETGLLGYKIAQQGTLSAQDLREYSGRLVTAYRYGSAFAYRFADASGLQWESARRHQSEIDRRFARNAGRRFADETGVDLPSFTGGLPRVNENSPHYDALEDALHSGDAGQVRGVVAEWVSKARTDKERAERLRQLRVSALGRQPIKPGGAYGREDQEAFRLWMRRRLVPEDQRRIREVQRRYFRTGRLGGLFTAADEERYAR